MAQSALYELRLGVDISYVTVEGCDDPYPVLRCSDFLIYVDRFNFWDKLLGIGVHRFPDASRRLLDFWGHYKQLYPSFPVFAQATEANIPLDRIIPVYVHGDEGTHFKKNAVMILQWQSAIGAGTAKNSINLDILGNLAGKEYGANQRGVTLTTRFLYTVMPKDTLKKFPLVSNPLVS